MIVVHVEAQVEAKARVQRKRADERRRLKPRVLQQRRQRLRIGWQPVSTVVADAVLKRIPPREHAGVGAQRGDGVGVRELETHALRGEPVERRRRRRSAIAAQRVGAQRVDGDQENILRRDRVQISLRRAPCTRREHKGAQRNDGARQPNS
jgi:hypothetical protein